MTIEFGLTDDFVNTQYAPLAALLAHYQQNLTLKPLENVLVSMRERDFSPSDKLIQLLASILTGCESQSKINTRLKHENELAKSGGWDRLLTSPISLVHWMR